MAKLRTRISYFDPDQKLYGHKYACFTCRKVFKKRHMYDWVDAKPEFFKHCPACGHDELWTEANKAETCANCGNDLASVRFGGRIKTLRGDYLRCPACAGKLHDVGLHFKAPKRKDQEAWTVAERLIAAGIRYEGEYRKPPGYRPTRLREVDAFIEQWKSAADRQS